MSEKRFTVILKCEQRDKKHQECEYYIEMDGVERPLKDILAENEQLKAKASSWKITCSQESNEKNVLFMKNRQLQEVNEQLRQKLKSVTMLKDDYEELIESFEKKYGKNIEDVIDV